MQCGISIFLYAGIWGLEIAHYALLLYSQRIEGAIFDSLSARSQAPYCLSAPGFACGCFMRCTSRRLTRLYT